VPPPQLADPDSRFALVGGVALHYKEVGAGDVAARGAPVLLLVHGFNGSVFNWWAAAGAGWQRLLLLLPGLGAAAPAGLNTAGRRGRPARPGAAACAAA
jgi:pimeloyl-ACP methyl ester carboxylesterase